MVPSIARPPGMPAAAERPDTRVVSYVMAVFATAAMTSSGMPAIAGPSATARRTWSSVQWCLNALRR